MDTSLDFKDILLVPADISDVESRSQVTIAPGTFSAANMEHCGTFTAAAALARHEWWTYIHKHYSYEEWQSMAHTAGVGILDWMVPTIGSSFEESLKLIEILKLHNFKRVCLDVANGHSRKNLQALEDLIAYRDMSPYDFDIVYGNIANPHTLDYINSDVIVKVGIGPGSHCTTRLKAGIGVPQISLLQMMKEHQPERRIISDGGIRNPGDAVKALVFGAEEVMMGGVLGGYNETSTEVYGSASQYSRSFKKTEYSTAEGIMTIAAPKGEIKNLVLDYKGGMRSACAYLGVYNSADLVYNEDIEFVIVNRQVDNF